MTSQEINHRIATDIKGWKFIEDGWYDDGSGFYNPLPDYCHSISHAVDLAKASNISMQPTADGWKAISMVDDSIASDDSVLATAIAMTALTIFDSSNV